MVELVYGPCDGEMLDVSAVPPEELEDGVALTATGCAYPGGRSWYDPRPITRLYWAGDSA
jgi:hypothetical protein